VAIDGASDPVLRLTSDQWQQPYNDVRPQRKGSLWAAPRDHHRLPNPEPMSRHGGYLGWHRIESNGPAGSPAGENDMTGRRQGTDPYLLVGAIVKARSSSRCVGTLSHHPIARPGNGRMVGREKHHDHPQRRRR
jgi:hypothetical protein